VDIYSLSEPPRDKNFQSLSSSLGGARRTRNGELRDSKRPRAIEHDAQLISAIEGLVAQDSDPVDPFGPRYWLITHDKHLVDCARTHGKGSKQCIAMLADEWVQYISPFLSPDTSTLDPAKAFAGLLSSRFMPSLGRRMALSEIQVFAEPEVAGLTAGLSREEACRAISDAHLEAVTRGGSKQQTDEQAVRKLADIAAKKRAQMERKGHLVPATRLEDLRAEREQEAVRYAMASDEQTQRMGDLEARLWDAEADRQTSLSYLTRKLRFHLSRGWSRFIGWIKHHPVRAFLYLSFVSICAVVLALGIGSLLEKAVGISLILVTWLTADPEQIRKNLRGLRGK
jgi:hypothetical protein